MKRPLLTLAVVGLGSVLTLSACGSSGSGSADGTTTIRFVAADYGANGENPSRTYWESVISAFTKNYPKIKVDLQVVDWNWMVQNGNQPDVLQTGGYADFAKSGLLYPAEDVLSTSTMADFVPSMLDAGRQGETTYGIPFVSSARMFLINDTLFKQAGLDPSKPPQTWAEVTKAATALKKAGVEVPLGIPLGREEAQAESFIWMMGNGGGYQSGGEYTINSVSNVETFTQLKKWVDGGLTEKSPASVNRTDLTKDFASGKVGMINGSPGQLAELKGMDVTWSAMPGKDRQSNSTLGVGDWVMAFKKSGHRKEIKSFLDFIYQQEHTVSFATRYNLLPVTRSGLNALEKDPAQKALKPFLDILPNATFYPTSDPTWPGVSAQIKTQIGSAVSGDPTMALDALQRAAQQAAR
ncbi:extracellular solute-binding protein [Streptomyces sp. NBC_00435]|uniref:ABC transporter substrate-binding protein n=1 Tax=Streptomyces sp. NBC_00435 TaxID=2903649 RepID=UPI002E2145BD